MLLKALCDVKTSNFKNDANPTYGCQIRVNRGLYYHHGIYVSDKEVIHFTGIDGDSILDTSNVCVRSTSLEEFLKGGVLEVRFYSAEEEMKKKSADEIVKYAKGKLGIFGYDLLLYNCEHFSNECTFGEKRSDQVRNILTGNIFGW